MPDTDDQFKDEVAFEELKPNSKHYTKVGRIASEWARFEFEIDRFIWSLANDTDEKGACVTAQMMGSGPRLRAALALCELSGVISTHLMSQLRRFANDNEALVQLRNRAVHDPWVVGVKTKRRGQIRLTANKKLDYRLHAQTLDDLDAILSKIEGHVERFSVLRQKLRAEMHLAAQETSREKP
jgi:threonine dehydrogenase-like Zn-dependent dehydrogenase